ncbi:AAA family ATPase [Shimia sp. R11_0]|uniref:phage NrS-1 polymerase family protein n=1 Tax=Shimia sp. R11_0 TaxID=2821096 RepID=UPI001AD9E5F7|nr:AAA family ATPase [Shimia sp. R11_0]MBO9477894.1 AAA family ATPase [Shimia sp. R11_0]
MTANLRQNIPEELRSYPQWVCHDAAKRPINPQSGHLADVGDPTTWAKYEDATNSPHGVGIGFVFTEADPFVGIDLDVAEGGTPSEGQQRIYDAFDTYAERSPSGRGLHIIAKGKVAEGGVRNSNLGVEIYSSGRFFTFTGDAVRNQAIADCQSLVDTLRAQIAPNRGAAPTAPDVPEREADAAIVERAKAATNGAKFAKLWEGHWQSDYPSQSDADQALVNFLAFYTQNRAQIARIFRTSALGQRKKAQREDYVDRTVTRALDGRVSDYRYTAEAIAHGKANADAILATHAEKARKAARRAAKSRVRSARQLQGEDFPAINWVVENVLPEGLTIFAGVPKVGKSWLALDIARAKASGDRVLGQPCERGDVLLLALEDNGRRLQDRLRRVAGSGQWPANMDYATEWSRLDEGGLAEIESWIEDADAPALIVIDTLAMVKPVPTGRNQSAYDYDVKALKPLHKLASEKRVAIIVVTHTRKAAADDPVEKVSSTLGLTGVADTIMLLGRGPQEQAGILYARGRDIAEFNTAVKFVDFRWQIEGDPTLVFAGDTQKILIDAIKNGATTPKEMELATGINSENVRQTLQRMVKAQRVYRHSRGVYTLPAWNDRPQFSLGTPVTNVTSHSE